MPMIDTRNWYWILILVSGMKIECSTYSASESNTGKIRYQIA